jgi:hypothetical protein
MVMDESKQDLQFEDVRPEIESLFDVRVEEVSWFSAYRIHHRVASRFQQENAFLLGDAGHVHSPVGAQGMNTGLLDAANLAWKLASGKPELIRTYALERESFARFLVRTTDQAFLFVSGTSPWMRLFRTLLMPLLFFSLTQFRWARRLMFRLISQIHISYRKSPLSQGPGAGDRLPWTGSNYGKSLDWEIHLYGGAPLAFATRVSVRHFPAHPAFLEGALYLVRPDQYIGLVQPKPNQAELEAYLERWV